MAKVEKKAVKKVTASGIISDGIEKTQSVKMILSRVLKKIPDSKADETHVKFYARKALKAGTLDEAVAAKKYSIKPAKVKADPAESVATSVTRKVKTKTVEAPKKPKVSRKKSGDAVEKKASKKRKATSKA